MEIFFSTSDFNTIFYSWPKKKRKKEEEEKREEEKRRRKKKEPAEVGKSFFRARGREIESV